MTESVSKEYLRNVAIIAHVDHGKTTLVDRMLYQSGMFRTSELDKMAGGVLGLIMDSNPLERERGITILSKNCALNYTAQDGNTYKINIIDTPGHADFSGEVERILQMADGVLLLVDAFDGPMPQTRFVLQKSLEAGLKPIVIVNKVDRPESRPHDVVNEVFDLLVSLNANDHSLDFPLIFASARQGWATPDLHKPAKDLRAVFEAIVNHVPAPSVKPDEPLQMLVNTLDYSDYVGKIGIGRIVAGALHAGKPLCVIDRQGNQSIQKPLQVFTFEGLGRKQVETAYAGDICAVLGLEHVDIGVTLADAECPKAIPTIQIGQPTLDMTFRVNDGPFAGREGTYVTTRQIAERLEKEMQTNVALQVAPGDTPDEFRVSGRGLLHLGILLENMRREGYELCAGKPKVILKEVNGRTYEPVELLAVDCPIDCQNSVMALMGDRRAEIQKMDTKTGAEGYLHMEFSIPARGLIGLRSRMLTATQGRAIMHHTFLEYQPMRGAIGQRAAGVMIASHPGQVTPYALDGLYDRGMFFVKPGDQVYEGQVVGEHCKDNDILVNVTKTKQLTNIRAAGKDDNAQIRPAREMALEACLEYIQDDELVEITPKSLRIRKRLLSENDRRRAARRTAG